jgi:hypothetical protein
MKGHGFSDFVSSPAKGFGQNTTGKQEKKKKKTLQLQHTLSSKVRSQHIG